MKTKLYRTLIIFAAVMCLCTDSLAIDLGERVIKSKLSNGVTVLMLERHFSPTVSLYIRHRIGAVDEIKGESGAAHLLEHMMFKGTTTIGTRNYAEEKILLEKIESAGEALDQEKRKADKADRKLMAKLKIQLKKLQTQHKRYVIPNEIDRLYTENGGLDMNASTGQDLTTYNVSLPSNKIELWARIETDRLLNPVFREFYTERDVVMEERRQRVEADPDGKLYEQFISTAYNIHPYGRPVIGWAEDIKYLSPDSLRKIFAKYKKPESIVIAVVGDLNPEHTLKLIDQYFGRIPSVQEMKNDIVPEEPVQAEERRVSVTFDANPMIIIGFHKPNAPAYDDLVFDLLETILTTGRTSRLYRMLVTEMQIAESITASNGIPGSRYSNLFTIFAKPRHPHTNPELEENILQEIEKLKNEPVTDEELIKAKKHLKIGYIQSLDSNAELASILSYYEILLGDFRYFSNYLDLIEKVTAVDIQKAAMLYLNKGNRTVAILNKKKD